MWHGHDALVLGGREARSHAVAEAVTARPQDELSGTLTGPRFWNRHWKGARDRYHARQTGVWGMGWACADIAQMPTATHGAWHMCLATQGRRSPTHVNEPTSQ